MPSAAKWIKKKSSAVMVTSEWAGPVFGLILPGVAVARKNFDQGVDSEPRP